MTTKYAKFFVTTSPILFLIFKFLVYQKHFKRDWYNWSCSCSDQYVRGSSKEEEYESEIF